MTPEILAALEAAKREKRPVVLATRLPGRRAAAAAGSRHLAGTERRSRAGAAI